MHFRVPPAPSFAFNLPHTRAHAHAHTHTRTSEGACYRAKVKVVKNKVAPPFQTTEFDIMYGLGVSKVGEILDLGVEYEIIKKSGSWFSYGDTKLGQGRDAVKSLIGDNPELAEELEGKIIEVIRAS